MQPLDEQLICQEYQETNLGIEALATRYHVGKLKIKKILKVLKLILFLIKLRKYYLEFPTI